MKYRIEKYDNYFTVWKEDFFVWLFPFWKYVKMFETLEEAEKYIEEDIKRIKPKIEIIGYR